MLTSTLLQKGQETYSPIGIDIGNRSINMVQLKKSADGIKIHAAARREVEKGDFETEGTLHNLLTELKKEDQFVNKTAISRMPHAKVSIIPIQIEKSKDEIETALVREAERYLPYTVEEAVLDYIPMHHNDAALKKVMLVASKRLDIDQHIDLLKAAGFSIKAIDVGPNALLRLFRFIDNFEKRLLLINVGKQQTYFTILWDGCIMIDRAVNWGEDCLVRRLVKGFQISSVEAVRMLYTYGIKTENSVPLLSDDGVEALSNDSISHAIFQTISKDLEEFVEEAEKVLVYCASENRGTMIDQTYLMGGSTHFLGGETFVNDLYPYLESRLGIKAKTIYPLRAFKGDFPDHYNPACFSVSIGLALRGFEESGGFEKNDA